VSNSLGVLFVTPEAHPLVKTGGLGDVGGGLPPALQSIGVDARLLLPAYPGLIEASRAEPVGPPFPVLPQLQMGPVRLFRGLLPRDHTPAYLVGCPLLYERGGGPYVDESGKDWPDNALRFGLLSRVAALFGTGKGLTDWRPHIIHCNDWQTGLIPAYLAQAAGNRVRTVLTIHNMAFQGNFPPELIPELDLPWSMYKPDGIEFYGRLSFLKAGLFYADHLTTVSPTYAAEIQTSEFGYGMEGLLATRKNRLTGILNGVDNIGWNPETDAHLPAHYSSGDFAGKAANKRALQERLGLPVEPDTPVLGIVSRLTYQKGTDLVLDIAGELLKQPLQLVVLGTGQKIYESRLRQLAVAHPSRVGIAIGYDEGLAHLVEAGADIFLMPSRFEPCGLNQMYSMLYGTPPVVHAVGGLADSVVDATPASLADGTATGFLFHGANPAEVLAVVMRALLLYGNGQAWHKLQVNGMKRDFSWKCSARKYLEIYQTLLAGDELTTTPSAPSRGAG